MGLMKAELKERRQGWDCLHLLALQSTQAPTRSKRRLGLCGLEVLLETQWVRDPHRKSCQHYLCTVLWHTLKCRGRSYHQTSHSTLALLAGAPGVAGTT
jgi:hypothetical protein